MAIRTDTPVQYLKGVGPRLGDVLRKRGFATVGELLHWYPRAYEDRRVARSVASLQAEEIVSLAAQIVRVSSYNLGRSRRKIYDVMVKDATGAIHCKYFRTPYKGYFERFQPGQAVRVVGKVTDYRGRLEFHHPDLRDLEKDEDEEDQLVPLYTETEGLSPHKIRRLMAQAIEGLIDEPAPARVDWARKEGREAPLERIEPLERLPQWLLEKYQLIPLDQALKGLHQPPRDAGAEFTEQTSSCHRRVIFEEFFWLELYLATRQTGFRRQVGVAMKVSDRLMGRVEKSLPFQLTGGQKQTLRDIRQDLARPYPMNRMVQGDVGCGKTMVALLAAVAVVEAGHQVALMVPTEILAEQHFKSAEKLLAVFGVRLALLKGQQKASEKREVLQQLVAGDVNICVGTHALIQEDVDFKSLGLVIIDEQHRFGVHQRARLKSKGRHPHFLVMTATPIPRTLAMTVYGDLDVSLISELPAGRQPIVTRVTYQSKRQKVMQFLCDQVAKGRQAYIVYPLVEESEKIDLKDAISSFEHLQAQWPQLKFGLLHGKMKAEEKDHVMKRFRAHEFDVLVATTVIEVGVDVPNANLIIIEHTERFGLSQLHQLRGRVGRGRHKSFCVLMMGHAMSEEARERALIMEKTADGFKIAEADLELRGPGEFLGTKQSGLPGFRLANLVRDIEVLTAARAAAFEVLQRDPRLQDAQHLHLREGLVEAHGSAALASIG